MTLERREKNVLEEDACEAISELVMPYEYKEDENYDLTSQMAVVFILELIGRELKGVHNDTDDLFQNDMEDLFH